MSLTKNTINMSIDFDEPPRNSPATMEFELCTADDTQVLPASEAKYFIDDDEYSSPEAIAARAERVKQAEQEKLAEKARQAEEDAQRAEQLIKRRSDMEAMRKRADRERALKEEAYYREKELQVSLKAAMQPSDLIKNPCRAMILFTNPIHLMIWMNSSLP